MDKFPKDFGNELAGMSFEDLFEKSPKWVEYVDDMWTDDCTGLFRKLRDYILLRLKDPVSKAEHEARCAEYVKSLKETDVPPYLLKYVGSKPPRI